MPLRISVIFFYGYQIPQCWNAACHKLFTSFLLSNKSLGNKIETTPSIGQLTFTEWMLNIWNAVLEDDGDRYNPKEIESILERINSCKVINNWQESGTQRISSAVGILSLFNHWKTASVADQSNENQNPAITFHPLSWIQTMTPMVES